MNNHHDHDNGRPTWDDWDPDTTLATTAERVTDLVIAPAHAPTKHDDSPIALMMHAAQSLVRDQGALIERAKQIGGLLGGGGFYAFPTGAQTVQGPSIDLAEALAQAWGGIAYQVRILDVQLIAGGGRKVHLRATVTDLKMVVGAEVDQVVTTSAPPGKFASKIDQAERWHAMQTQSAASKIVRNAIFRVLPSWYVTPALNAALEADSLNATKGKSLPEARAARAGYLAEKHRLTVKELEAVTGQPYDMWAVPQLAQLRDLAVELKHGRTSVEQIRASLQAEAAPSKPTGKSALGLAGGNGSPKKPTPEAIPRDPGDDDDTPPEDPQPRGRAESSDTDARGEGADAAPQGGAQAKADLRVVRDEEQSASDDYVHDAEAWTLHLEAAENEHAIAGAYHKRSGAFGRHNVREERKRATVTALAQRNGGDRTKAAQFLEDAGRRKASKAA